MALGRAGLGVEICGQSIGGCMVVCDPACVDSHGGSQPETVIIER